jgi:hypothetical protein
MNVVRYQDAQTKANRIEALPADDATENMMMWRPTGEHILLSTV